MNKLLIPALPAAAVLGAFAGFAVSASPVPDLGAPVASAPADVADTPDPIAFSSPVEGDDAPVAAPAPAVDAGPATGIGTSPVVIPDPVEDPGAFGGAVLDATRSGKLALLAILVLLGLSRAAIWSAARWPASMGWAGGTARPWIVAAAGVLATLATSLATLGRVDMTAVAGAIAAAVALELKAAPPAKAPSLGGGKTGGDAA